MEKIFIIYPGGPEARRVYCIRRQYQGGGLAIQVKELKGKVPDTDADPTFGTLTEWIGREQEKDCAFLNTSCENKSWAQHLASAMGARLIESCVRDGCQRLLYRFPLEAFTEV